MLYGPTGEPLHNTAPLFQEVASADKDDPSAGFLDDLLVVKNEVLDGLPSGREHYAKLLRDTQVTSTFQQRRGALKSREWDVDAGGTRKIDRMAADWLRDTILNVGWDDVVDKMLYGVFYGYAAGELMYARDGRYVALDAVKVRKASRFRFGRQHELRLVTPGRPTGEPMPARKFWTFTHGAETHDDPYGTGLAHFLYWPVLMKRQGMKAALTYLERFAHPTPIGKYPPGTDKAEVRKLLQSLNAMTTALGIVVPQGFEVDKFEGTRTGDAAYGSFEERMDQAISKVVLSQTMTSDDGSSQSQAEVHMEVAEWVVKSDADLLCGSFRAGPLRWLTEWNFPGAKPPSFWYVFDEPEDLEALAERDSNLFSAGWRRTQQSMDETYGEGAYERTQTAAEASVHLAPAAEQTKTIGREQAPAELAEEPQQVPPDEAFVPHLEQHADPIVADWVEQARALLAEAGSLGEFSDRLVELYPDLDVRELASVFGDGLAAATAAGRYEVREGR